MESHQIFEKKVLMAPWKTLYLLIVLSAHKILNMINVQLSYLHF